jgi:hypothetical protein
MNGFWPFAGLLEVVPKALPSDANLLIISNLGFPARASPLPIGG